MLAVAAAVVLIGVADVVVVVVVVVIVVAVVVVLVLVLVLALLLSVVVMLHADADADRVRELVRLPAGPSSRDAPLESGLSARRAQTQQVTPLLELWVDAPPCRVVVASRWSFG